MKRITLAVTAIGIILCSSCSKSDSNAVDNADKFAGNYYFTSPCFPTGAATGAVTKNNASSVNLPIEIGAGTSCSKLIWVPASVSGNSIQSTTNTLYDACSTPWNVTMSGNINGNTLTLLYSGTVNGSSWSCTYIGTKQ